jgi:hypothetical protein
LPVLVNYTGDELLSSWLRRTAQLYEVSPQGLLIHFGITPPDPLRLIDFALPTEVQTRLHWCLRTNVQRMRQACHPASASFARNLVAMAEPISYCFVCNPKGQGAPKALNISKSWFESWRVACGRCGRPFHLHPTEPHKIDNLPRVSDELWTDAQAGSAIFTWYLAGKPCGPLPPQLTWRLISAVPPRANGYRTGFGRMVPESLHPAFGTIHQSPVTSIRTENHFKRLALLAALQRFNERPKAWIEDLTETATQAGRATILGLLDSLPDKLRETLTPYSHATSSLPENFLYASHEVQATNFIAN